MILNKPEKLELSQQSYLASEGCLALYQTNVRMSGNHKLVYQDDDHLFIESISSNEYLANSAFKKYAVDINQGYLHNLRMFFKNVASHDSIWYVEQQVATKAELYSEQYNNTYKWGAYNESNDLITSDFRFFAPIWVYNKLPDRFVIFRVPKNMSGKTLKDFINAGVLVKSIELKENTTLGKYIRTLTTNQNFTEHCMYVNFDDNYIRYHGIDTKSGKIIDATEYQLESYLANERTITEFDNDMTNGWMRNSLICPNIINLEFIFSDEEATEGLNSYMGFYCYDNEISELEATYLKYNVNGIVVLGEDNKETRVIKFNNNKPNTLQPYYKDITDVIIQTQSSSSLPPIIELELNDIPMIGSKFEILYDGDTIFSEYFLSNILDFETLDEILLHIANLINNSYFSNVSLYATVINSRLIIKSNVNSIEFESIQVIVPSSFKICSDIKYYNTTEEQEPFYNVFKGITSSDIILYGLQTLPTNIDKVLIDNEEFEIIQSFVYQNSIILRLDENFQYHNIENNSAKLLQLTYPSYYYLSYIKQVMFDMYMKTEETKYAVMGEEKLSELNTTNVFVPLVCKFANVYANDTQNQPLRLQISKAYTKYNSQPVFAYNPTKQRNSLDWFLIESDTEIGERYVSSEFTKLLTSTEYDAYDILKRNVSSSSIFFDKDNVNEFDTFKQYMTLSKLPGQYEKFMSIFLGLEWNLNGKYDNYRLCVIATNKPNVIPGVANNLFRIVANEVFKTLTIIIYLPNAKITPTTLYDGTLFDNVEITESIDTYSRVSFNLFRLSDKQDENEIKMMPIIINGNINRYHWFNIINDKPAFRIGYNQQNSFYTLKDIVKKSSFSWYYATVTPNVYLIIKFTAIDIFDIQDDHLWCRDIRMEFIPDGVRLEEFSPYITSQQLTWKDIYNSPTENIIIDGTTYKLPFWSKIKECGKNGYVSILQQYYEEFEDNVEYELSFLEHIKDNCPNGISFVKKNDVVGNLFDHDQFWFICQQFAHNALIPNIEQVSTSKLSPSYVKNLFDTNKVQLVRIQEDNIIDTTTNISVNLPSSTYIVTSIDFDGTELKRVDKKYSNIYRQSGYYAPLFRNIFVPKSIVYPSYMRQYATWQQFENDVEFDETRRRYLQTIWFADGTEKNDTLNNSQYKIFKRFHIGELMTNSNLQTMSMLTSNIDISELQDDVNLLEISHKHIGQLFVYEVKKDVFKLCTWKDSTFTDIVEIENADKFYKDAIISDKFISQFVGRKIVTVDEFNDSFFEIYENTFMNNPSCDKIYKSVISNESVNIITEVVNCIQRGMISSVLNFRKEFIAYCNFSETIDIPSLLKYIIGNSVLHRIENITEPGLWTDIYNAIHNYNMSVTPDNIIYEDVYDYCFRQFYKEQFSKLWKITNIQTEGGTKLDYLQQNVENVKLLRNNIHGTPIQKIEITFTRI